ncbi:MAG TPA: bifunctional acetate--CoA ligase family protein/GNAT family N-acetyltransferase [Thermoanaerobaculia bacterium]|nr:bifunctional acetate--CoA ligase family protein/GNAT family N-acetyltransferase [Thermoanaerobaculia bacterium]
MSILHLDRLLLPSSIAVIGASRRPGTVGRVVMHNLLGGGFEGAILPVHPEYDSVAGVLAYPRVADLPTAPDLGLVCTPAATVPGLIDELGRAGCRAAIVLSAGLGREESGSGATTQAMLDAARPYGLRVLGPNCLGLLAPHHGLNASFAHLPARPGRLAFLSQSGGLCTAVLDWAAARGIGFSCFASLGDSADVDFADLIDWLITRDETRAVLLYIESIRNARKFLSASRAAARVLPIVAVKAGRRAAGARAAASHTGALAGDDLAYDAALRRAGILRVDTTDELFDAVETVARFPRQPGSRLAVISNSGGPAVLATDRLERQGGALAELADSTLAALDQVLPATWSRCNPVDLVGDANGERYRAAIEAVAADPGIDAILVMHAPTATVSSVEAAAAVVAARESARPPILTAWLGGDTTGEPRRRFHDAGVPTYETPEDAVDAFIHLVHYHRVQESLRQAPAATPVTSREAEEAALDRARALVERALADGRSLLSEPESKELLAAFGIPVLETKVAADAEEAVALAAAVGAPVAIKVHSAQVSHKTEVGGVELGLDTPADVRAACGRIAERLARLRPDARLDGFLVQPMVSRRRAHELLVGAACDDVFGPVVLFGQGGTAAELIADRALALPPLNRVLARDLISQPQVTRLLRGYRDRPPADLDALEQVLVQISEVMIELPEVQELDINPLLADDKGVLAVDARVRVAPASGSGESRLAIRPYPRQLEETITLADGETALLRPIRPEDEEAHARLFAHLDPESVYFRFFSFVRQMPHDRLARYTQIDYDREMAFIATREIDGVPTTLGAVRAIFGSDRSSAEFAIVVASEHQGHGLGRQLLEKVIRYCREQGTAWLTGQVLWNNRRMRALAKQLGFESRRAEGNVVEVRLALQKG